MSTKECCDILKESKIKPTAIRILVYKEIAMLHNTFSLNDLEEELYSVDKSSIFRALTLFHDRQLIHSIDDGSGKLKYCLCRNQGKCHKGEEHCHFYCEKCKKTFCLENCNIPNVYLPEGFSIRTSKYLIKGICANCQNK